VSAPAPTRPTRFRQGAGRISLDFIRTLRYRGLPDATEEIPDIEALFAWVRQCGPVATTSASADRPSATASASVRTTTDPADARALREAVATLIAAGRGADGLASCDPEARRRVNKVAAQPVPVPFLDARGRLTWRVEEPVSATLAVIARDALDLVTSAALERLRECANPTCQALFVDNSRPGSRRWCSMDSCGNQAKKAGLRNRRAAQ
jgi:predicted RNA-binding Zn ribbon-like protein